MSKLVISTKGHQWEVELAERNLLGRHANSSIKIPDPGVSGVHCLIAYNKKRGFSIKDLGSLNGTYLNRKRINQKKVLRNGDKIVIGNSICVFKEEASIPVVRMDDEIEEKVHSQILSDSITFRKEQFLAEQEIQDESELRQDYEKLRITYELQRDIGFELNLDTILRKILNRTFEFLSCDRGAVLLKDEKDRFKARVVKSNANEENFIISSTLIRQIVKEKNGIISTDALADKRFDGSKSIVAQGTRASISVPILDMDMNEVLGILTIDSSVAVNVYTEKDLRLLTNIANQISMFIRNLCQMARKIEKESRTRKRFQRLLSPDLAEMVVSGKLRVKKGGEDRVATVMFADIRGFTAISENSEATEVLHMLNDYFEIIVDIVFQHEGTVDKFIGDEMMVIWGAPVRHDDDPARAVRAAIDIQKALVEFNQTREAEEQHPVHVGVGINTGNLVAGYIGSSRTMSYSVIGDTVNTAKRLCSAAAAGQIIISVNTFEQVGKLFDISEMEPIKAKGKHKTVRAFRVDYPV